MSERRLGCLARSGLALLLVSAWAGVGRAQPVAGAQGGGASAPEAAAVVQFAPEGVSLEEAVQLTVTHSPAIKLAESDARRQAGVAQQQSGLFDLSMAFSASFERRVQALSESLKEAQRGGRADLGALAAQSRTGAAQTERLIGLLRDIDGLPPGSQQVNQVVALDPAMGSQIQALDALILGSPASVRADLLRARQNYIASSLTTLRRGLEESQASAANAEQALAQLGAVPDDELFQNSLLGVQASKRFRSGVAVSPFFDTAMDSTRFVGKPISAEFGGLGVEDTRTLRAGVNVSVPLWRGRGSDVFGAAERAARIESEASRLLYEHRIATAVLSTVRGYWDLRAAQESRDAVARSVEIADRITEVTRNLILAGELPAVELARAQATDARSRGLLNDAERQLYEARVALATAIGVAPGDTDSTLPRAKEAFPETLPTAIPTGAVESLSASALAQRKDVGAARQIEQAGRVLEAGARGNVPPRVDLTAGSWLTAFGEPALGAVTDRWTPSVTLGIEVERPLANNAAVGLHVQAEADRRQRQISAADLTRQVRLDVLRTAETLGETIERARQAAAAAGFYRSVVDAEIERFRARETTLIDTLLTQEQLTDALLTLASAQRDLWSLVAETRFQAGTLIEGTTVVAPNLVTLPSAAGRTP